MITTSLRIAILLAIAVYFIILAVLLRKKYLSLRFTLLWLLSGFLMLLITIFPGLLQMVTKLLGFQLGSNALFSILFFCVLIILVSLTSINSRQGEAIRRLTQELAMLEKRLGELEEKRKG